MPWQELRITLDPGEVPRAEALIVLAGAAAVSLAGTGRDAVLEPAPGETPLWKSVTLTALFPPGAPMTCVTERLRHALALGSALSVRPLHAEDWSGARKQQPGVIRVGKRLLLAPAEENVSGTGRAVVRLRLGLAFGTGEHPTTALCLEWLDEMLPRGARILDYGCGSGILSLAALRLGAASAWAVDIEPQALRATRENARLNGLTDQLWAGTPQALPPVQADVVIANILAGPLRELREALGGSVGPEGHLVLSGLLKAQGEEICRHYGRDFGPFAVTEREGWILVSARHRAEDCSRKEHFLP